MTLHPIVDGLAGVEPLGCLGVLAVMYARKALTHYKALAMLLAARIISAYSYVLLDRLAGSHLSRMAAYKIWFSVYWTLYACDAILGLLIIYGIYNLAMAPLAGLQRLGRLMFRWAGGIAVAIAFTMAVGPNVTSLKFVVRAVTQLQQTQSVLTLCMLLFVCLAIRPMGLTYRSEIFGVSLGLGVLAATDLVQSAWNSHASNLYSSYTVINGLAICFTLLLWMAYFAIPEPKRRMIILPTTSPFLRWNQISLALGDAPGFVAVGEVSPDMFAPAEVEVMRRASLKMPRAVAM